MRRVATIEAMCTKGPSLPSGIPEPNVAVRPTTFATSVLDNKDRFYCGKLRDLALRLKMTLFVRVMFPIQLNWRDLVLGLENGNTCQSDVFKWVILF